MLLHVLIIKWEKLCYSKAKLQENTQHIPGTDGQKMSKSKIIQLTFFFLKSSLKSKLWELRPIVLH